MTPQDLRIHWPDRRSPRPGGEFVLYWMQTTHRAHDNFAFNFSVEQADALGLPVLVYHGLRRDYPWASDRIHTFVLQSVVDLYRDFADLGVQYAFYLDRDPRPVESPLKALAGRAALVVTDFFPTFIVPRQNRSLARSVEVPVIPVESSTVVPLREVDREHKSARTIRPVLLDALQHHLHPVGTREPRVRRTIDLPFEPTTPTAASISGLVASCDIDHSVPPSPTLRGGSTAARERLAYFIRHGLPRYADDRNDPNLDVTSRLSAYLHFGNISPHEMLLAAREAGPSDQYAKFEDEAVTWRELAHNFVFHNPKHRTVEAIPDWARKELGDHEADPRPALYSDQELEFARTGDELWNACQRSLLRDGELHNYVRMLWGKAVLQWTPTYAKALEVLEHLNNKYALDGRDPNSYGGILWTFGKFDRPFYRRPIYGTVRYQSLKAAREKFDVPAYVKRFA